MNGKCNPTQSTHDGFPSDPASCFLSSSTFCIHLFFFFSFSFSFSTNISCLFFLFSHQSSTNIYTNVMKKTSDAIVIYHQDESDQNSEDECRSSPNISSEVEKAIDQSNSPKSPPTPQPIKLTSKGAIQLTSSSTSSNATTNAILNLKINPFFHDKRKWDDSFTVAEKKELTGNIVKAASKFLFFFFFF